MARESSTFPGVQEDERILYCITPHPLRLWVGIFRISIVMAGAFFFWHFLTTRYDFVEEQVIQYGYWALSAFAIAWIWWNWRSYIIWRAFITDRRIVRFEAVFPILEKKRALFWGEVTKAKGSGNFFHRIINIGTLEIVPFFLEDIGSIDLPYTHYFEDLASYVEKLVFYFKTKPDALSTIRPFVARPKGQRYPPQDPSSPSQPIGLLPS